MRVRGRHRYGIQIRIGITKLYSWFGGPLYKAKDPRKDVDLEGALEAAEILKRAKTDANCYETEKHQATVAVVSAANSKCDLSSESTEDIGALGPKWCRCQSKLANGRWLNNISYFPQRSLCNGSTTFQTNPVPLLGLHMPFLPINSVFPKRGSLLTPHQPTSRRLSLLTVPR